MRSISETINESIFSAPKATGGLNSIFAGDYLPTLYPGHEDDSKYTNYKFKIFKNGPFKDGLNIIPRTTSSPASLIIEDYQGESITIPPIAKVQGNLTIQNCPNLKTLDGLFKPGANGDLPVITGNLIIYNCPKLDDLADNVFPVVYGDMTIQNCPKITSLPRVGGPTQGGNVTFLHNGRKLKKDKVKKAYPYAKMIFCSQEDVERSKIDESMMINEDFSNPVLSLVNDAFKKCRSTKVTMANTNNWRPAPTNLNDFLDTCSTMGFGVAWDKISPMCGMKFDWGDPKSKKEMLYTIKKYPKSIVIAHIDYDGHVDMVYFDSHSTAVFFDWKNHRRTMTKMHNNNIEKDLVEVMDMFNRIQSTTTDFTLYVIIPGLDNSNSGNSMWKLKNDRHKSQEGVVLNTPEYYQKCIRENHERYKKLKAQRVANSKYDKILQEKIKIADDLNNQVHDALSKAYHSPQFLTKACGFYVADVMNTLRDLTSALMRLANEIQGVKDMNNYSKITYADDYIKKFDLHVADLNRYISSLLRRI